jgi:hypothetical protein
MFFLLRSQLIERVVHNIPIYTFMARSLDVVDRAAALRGRLARMQQTTSQLVYGPCSRVVLSSLGFNVMYLIQPEGGSPTSV